MSRKPLIRSTNLPYHITARVNNRELFPCALGQAWRILCEHCYKHTLLQQLQVHALVLMPNHFHLIATVPMNDLGQVMQDLMKSVTRTINTISGRWGRVFGSRYHWTLIDSYVYFSHVLKYVYRNPVRAGICQTVEEFRWSTLQGLYGFEHLPVPIYFPFKASRFELIPDAYDDFLNWLNRPFQKEHEQAIQRALRRTLFIPPKADNKTDPHGRPSGSWKRPPSALEIAPL